MKLQCEHLNESLIEFLFGSIVYHSVQGSPKFEPSRVESLQGSL